MIQSVSHVLAVGVLALQFTLTMAAGPAAAQAEPPAQRPAVQPSSMPPGERRTLIDTLVTKWGPYIQEQFGADVEIWRERLSLWFLKADATNLREAVTRDSYDGAMAALLGRGARVPDATVINGMRDRVDGPGDGSGAGGRFGDLTQDVVYTPITPCRIVDTRGTGAGAIPAAAVRSFVAINSSSFTSQGGSATDCGTLFLAATAVAINVTAVAPAGAGYTTVYPFGTTLPLTASLNYSAGAIVNNSLIAQIPNPLSSFDFTIYTFAQSHYVVDIVGYFAPPQATALQCVDTAQATATISAGAAGISVAPTCATGYTPTSTNCAVSNLEMLLASANNGICAGKNTGASDAILRASRTCCRVPGR